VRFAPLSRNRQERLNLRVLVLGINYAPELTGIGKYTGEMARWLAEQGHDVRVITAPPYYPQWKVAPGYSPLRYCQERNDNIRVWRCPLYVPSTLSGPKRLLHLASFAASSFPVMLRQIFWKPNVVIGIEPPLFCAPTTWLTAKLAGARSWLHVQDFEVDAAFDVGVLSSYWLRRAAVGVESWLMRRFDCVSTISTSMVERLRVKGVDEESATLFPNWADLDRVHRDESAAEDFRLKHGIPATAFVALYSGNMGEKQGLEIVLDAAHCLRGERDVLFLLCGDGAARTRLEQQARMRELENVRFLALQSAEDVAGMLSAADLHLVIQKPGAADLVMPSKLTNIMAVGGFSLITATTETELGRLLKEHPFLGILCSPNDLESLVAATLSRKAFRANRYVPRVRRYAEETIARVKVLGEFENHLKQIAGEG